MKIVIDGQSYTVQNFTLDARVSVWPHPDDKGKIVLGELSRVLSQGFKVDWKAEIVFFGAKSAATSQVYKLITKYSSTPDCNILFNADGAFNIDGLYRFYVDPRVQYSQDLGEIGIMAIVSVGGMK